MSSEAKRFSPLLLTPLTHSGVKLTVMPDEYEALAAKLRHDNPSVPVLSLGIASCSISAGAEETREAILRWLRENGSDAELLEVGCVGLCSEEPLLAVRLPGRQKLSFSRVTAQAVPDLLSNLLGPEPEPSRHPLLGQSRESGTAPWDGIPCLNEHPFFRIQTRRVLRNCGIINPCSIDEYLARDGYKAFAKTLHTMIPSEVCEEIRASGLRGRGGAGFPTGQKWAAALNTLSNQKYMICNADEGDPGAFMARAMIEGDPHRLLEGLAIGSYAIGANTACIYIRAEYSLAIARLKKAIEQASACGLLGENILDSGFDLKILIKQGTGAFVCGEETALLNSIEGKRGMPRPRPPYPAEHGLFGKPSVVNNVETLANVPDIIRLGKEYFGTVGTEQSKGTKVFSLSGKIARSGLLEVAFGTELRELVYTAGGGIPNGKKFKALQIGGPSGACLPEQHLGLHLDYESLRAVGAMLGSGGVILMDEDNCMVDAAKFFMDFIQRESCGKCIPCREGTRRMLEILMQLTCPHEAEEGYDALRRFKGVMMLPRLARVIQDTSLCGLGKSAPNPVLSILRWFREEFDAHVYERRCPAGVCRGLVKYRIDAEKCKGCGVCAAKCAVHAIRGMPRMPHFIDPQLCNGCGNCGKTCKFGALSRDDGRGKEFRHV